MKKHRIYKVLVPALAAWVGLCGCREETGLVLQDAGNVSGTEESGTGKNGAGGTGFGTEESGTGKNGAGGTGFGTEESGTGKNGAGGTGSGTQEAGSGKNNSGTEQSEAGEQSGIYVQVSGAVKHPGVYELPQGSRVFQAVELAGGITGQAQEQSVNQAQILTDGQMIYIMTKEEAEEAQKTGEPGTAQTSPEEIAEPGAETDGKVNLNTASEEELRTLPGIGEAKAKSIIAWREANGGFSVIEDLMQIEGIKEGVFSKIKDSIKVN